jgi:hypothetical protein
LRRRRPARQADSRRYPGRTGANRRSRRSCKAHRFG